ncbi:MAG: hypothetical protein ABI629_11765 [bacterium]
MPIAQIVPVTACPTFDADADGAVSVSEPVAAVGNALDGRVAEPSGRASQD